MISGTTVIFLTLFLFLSIKYSSAALVGMHIRMLHGTMMREMRAGPPNRNPSRHFVWTICDVYHWQNHTVVSNWLNSLVQCFCMHWILLQGVQLRHTMLAANISTELRNDTKAKSKLRDGELYAAITVAVTGREKHKKKIKKVGGYSTNDDKPSIAMNLILDWLIVYQNIHELYYSSRMFISLVQQVYIDLARQPV